jgi:hypothetical protein
MEGQQDLGHQDSFQDAINDAWLTLGSRDVIAHGLKRQFPTDSRQLS